MKNNAERCWVAYSTVDSHGRATALAHRLVDEQLVACVNIVGPVESVYRWQGKVEQTKEKKWIDKVPGTEKAANKLPHENLLGEAPEDVQNEDATRLCT